MEKVVAKYFRLAVIGALLYGGALRLVFWILPDFLAWIGGVIVHLGALYALCLVFTRANDLDALFMRAIHDVAAMIKKAQ